DTARARATAAGEGCSVPLPGQTTAAMTAQAPLLAPTSCPHVLGKTAHTCRPTAAVSGAWAFCLPKEQPRLPAGCAWPRTLGVTRPPAQRAGGASARNQEGSMPSMPSDPHHEVPAAIQGYVALIGAIPREALAD